VGSNSAFRVVFLCTGNRFRSPLATATLLKATEGLPVEAESFGTVDVGPLGPLPEAARTASRLGLDLSGHRARGLPPGAGERADLVVGFERMHVAAAVVNGGAASDRTFTLPELVHFLGQFSVDVEDAIDHARYVVAAAAARRSHGAFLAELADPLGRSRRAQRQIGDDVVEQTERLALALFRGSTPPASAWA
jgi:protein-tyrosine phosphatase